MNDAHREKMEERKKARFLRHREEYYDKKRENWVNAVMNVGITNVAEFMECFGDEEIEEYFKNHSFVRGKTYFEWNNDVEMSFFDNNPYPEQ